MGVDYSGIGGIGIELTDDMKEMISDKYYSVNNIDEDDDDYENIYFSEILDDSGLEYSEAGSEGYGGEGRYYLLVDGNTLLEVQNNTDEFIKNLKNVGIEITIEDLQVISDLHIY
tara:strand:- start:154 stop:498 length:345 start_codon:yes stop_codon:yes gene_type:complete